MGSPGILERPCLDDLSHHTASSCFDSGLTSSCSLVGNLISYVFQRLRMTAYALLGVLGSVRWDFVSPALLYERVMLGINQHHTAHPDFTQVRTQKKKTTPQVRFKKYKHIFLNSPNSSNNS